MGKYILDTHACVHALKASRKLGKRARDVLRRVEAGRDEAWVPAAAVAEIVLLQELGRIDLDLERLRPVFDHGLWRFLSLDLAQLEAFASLSAIRDPFDRLIVSAARAVGAKLVTRDSDLAEGGWAQVVWD